MSEPIRRSSRITKGKEPERFGSWVKPKAAPATNENNTYNEHPNENDDAASSIHAPASSVRTTASSFAHRRAQADLDAAEALAILENEREERKLQRERELIVKRLRLQQAALDEEEGIQYDIHETDNSNANLPEHLCNPQSNELHRGREDIDLWMENGVSNSIQNSVLLNEMTKQFAEAIKTGVAMATEKSSRPTDSRKFIARQAAGKDLPNFDGKPEEWPTFLSQYNTTNDLCEFSEEEKLIRLQRCLKGKARDTVSSLLNLPGSVNQG